MNKRTNCEASIVGITYSKFDIVFFKYSNELIFSKSCAMIGLFPEDSGVGVAAWESLRVGVTAGGSRSGCNVKE